VVFTRILIVSALAVARMGVAQEAPPPNQPGRYRVQVISSIDGSLQHSYLILPSGFIAQASPIPLVVVLHSWSNDLEQRLPDWEAEAEARGWLYLFPNFRGGNDKPEACGSALAQTDILDAILWVKRHYPVDPHRVYLGGISGGGHMTMLMVGCHPETWTAASAWVGISDLREWYQTHATGRYGGMMRQCMGGPPGVSTEVDEEYRNRSPLTFLAKGAQVPLDLAAGCKDGHQGSVPISHSLNAFNELARVIDSGNLISLEEINQLLRLNGRLENPASTDTVADASFGREILLRRTVGPSRVTIFEGGHEGIASAAFAWFDCHPRP
jgi:dipeptidyl aminopeptidase/acylaminoacyl peptidase